MNKNDICAVLVTYYLENNLINHVKKIEKQVNKIVIIDNTLDNASVSNYFFHSKENIKIIINRKKWSYKGIKSRMEWSINNSYL